MKESYIFGHCGIFLHELHHTVGQLEGWGKHSKHTPTHTKPTFPEAVKETTGIIALILWDYTLQKDRKDIFSMGRRVPNVCLRFHSFTWPAIISRYSASAHILHACVFLQPLPSTQVGCCGKWAPWWRRLCVCVFTLEGVRSHTYKVP